MTNSLSFPDKLFSIGNKIYNAIYKAKEEIDDEYEKDQEWIMDIIENPDRGKMNVCEICGSKENLEIHHIRGKKHGNEHITVCQKCHDILTKKQRLWDSSWLNPNSPYKDIYLIRGLIDVFELKYEKTGHEIYKKIAEILTEGFVYE